MFIWLLVAKWIVKARLPVYSLPYSFDFWITNTCSKNKENQSWKVSWTFPSSCRLLRLRDQSSANWGRAGWGVDIQSCVWPAALDWTPICLCSWVSRSMQCLVAENRLHWATTFANYFLCCFLGLGLRHWIFLLLCPSELGAPFAPTTMMALSFHPPLALESGPSPFGSLLWPWNLLTRVSDAACLPGWQELE